MIDNTSFPKVILIEPQLGENIGSAARAMFNFGLNNLILINPRDGWPNNKAIATSAGALVNENFRVKVCNNIKDAIKDVSYVIATTARERDINKPVLTMSEAVKNIISYQNNQVQTAILFGGEKSGLNNKDLVGSDAIVNIETNKEFSSINLAMSVFAFCYHWSFTKNETSNLVLDKSLDNIANKSDLNYFLNRLCGLLEKNNFFIPLEKKESMINNIKAIFTRNDLSSQELRILHGIISNLITMELEDDS